MVGLLFGSVAEFAYLHADLLDKLLDAESGKVVRLPNLLVVEFTICSPERIDAGTITQPQKQALALPDAECNCVGNGPDMVWVQRLFLGHLLQENWPDVIRIRGFYKMSHLLGGAAHEPGLDKLVGNLPIELLKLAQPACQTFHIAHSR